MNFKIREFIFPTGKTYGNSCEFGIASKKNPALTSTKGECGQDEPSDCDNDDDVMTIDV